MIGYAVSLIGGIAVFNFYSFFPILISTSSIIAVFFLLIKGKSRKKSFLLILVFLFGFFYSFIRHDSVPEVKLPAGEILVQGSVIGVPEISGEKIRLTVKSKNIPGKVRLFFDPGNAGADILPGPGDRISALVKLKEPKVLHNPGVISYDIKKDGITAIGYAKHIQVMEQGKGVLSWLYNLRFTLGRVMDNSLSDENAALLKAIIPGLKRGIGMDMRNAFSATGLAHLLSISGTHFGLLAFIIFKFVRMLVQLFPVKVLTKMTLYITPTQTAIVLTIPILVFYAVISGASTPTIRALIMVFIYMSALFLGRKGQWLNSLSIAAITILLWRPSTLFELSFLLSFTAVLSIGLVLEKKDPEPFGTGQGTELFGTGHATEPHGSRQAHAPFSTGQAERGQLLTMVFDKVKTATLITAAAVLGTAPFVVLYFKQFPLISPVTNLIVTPLICFVILPIGFFSGFAALLFNLPVLPLNWLIDEISHFALILVKAFSNIPYANLRVHDPSFIIVVLYFLSLLFIVKSRFRWRFVPFILVIGLYIAGPYSSPNNFRVTFFDAGQGETSLVELPDNKIMLIDGSTGSPDIGRMIIAPHLWSKGIRHIDYLVLSHAHPDHFGGLVYIMDNFRIGEIWSSGRYLPEADDFFHRIEQYNIPHRILKRGDVLETTDYNILAFHPYDEFFAGSTRGDYSNQNSDSLVLKIESDGMSLLFTGDIEEEAEDNLVHLGKWLKSDIIKVPHHGSRTSSSAEFLAAVSPRTAVVSVGKNNSFNHPHEETVERYRSAGTRFFRTDMDGAITVTQNGSSYSIETIKDRQFKRVSSWKDELRNLSLLFKIF